MQKHLNLKLVIPSHFSTCNFTKIKKEINKNSNNNNNNYKVQTTDFKTGF